MLKVLLRWSLALQTAVSFSLMPDTLLGFATSSVPRPRNACERRPFEAFVIAHATSDDEDGGYEQSDLAPSEQLSFAGTTNPALSAQLLPQDRYLRVWPVALGTFGGAECVVLATVPGVGLVNGKDVLAVPLEPNTWAIPSWLPLPSPSSASFLASDDTRRNRDSGTSVSGDRGSSNRDSSSTTSYPTTQPSEGGTSSAAAQMMDRAVRGVPLPRSEFLRLSPALVNRDGGLYDNLPWEDWNTGDSQMGKRDAFNRFLGKDYPKSTYSSSPEPLGTSDASSGNEDSSAAPTTLLSASSAVDKAQRTLDVCNEEVRDLEASLATFQKSQRNEEAKETTTNSNENDSSAVITQQIQEAIARRDKAEDQLQEAAVAAGFDSNGGLLSGLLAKINGQISTPSSSASSSSQPSSAEPWRLKNLWSGLKRGTYDNNKSGNLSQKRVNDASAAGFTGYSSPYALMHELVDTQLRAKVLNVVLEDAWPLPVSLDGTGPGGSGAGGNAGWPQVSASSRLFGLGDSSSSSSSEVLVDDDMKAAAQASRQMGGAVQLERKPKTIQLAGFPVPDPSSGGGATAVVECFADEAIGIAIASNAPLWVEKSLWEDLKRPASIGNAKITPSGGVRLNIESKTTKTATTRTTSTKPSLAPPVPNVAEPAWEVKSASAFQAMSPVDKARTLLATDEFTRLRGRLPRPRTVEIQGTEGALDPLLLPLMDEAVRREVLVDRSLAKGDLNQAAALLEEASSRSDVLKLLQTTEDALSAAKKSASAAATRADIEAVATKNEETATTAASAAAAVPPESDFTGAATSAEMVQQLRARRDFLKSELGLLTDLRADYTQDEGEYSSYLDKDEWYERDRRRALGLDKKGD